MGEKETACVLLAHHFGHFPIQMSVRESTKAIGALVELSSV